jgi:hypothetical protein
MTSQEIKQQRPSDISTNSWLREVCLQLALLNEKSAPLEVSELPTERVKRAYTKRK